MKKTFIVLGSLAVLLLSGCSSGPSDSIVKGGKIADEIVVGNEMEQEEYVTQGMGAPNPDAANTAARRQTAMEAAKYAAYKNIAEYLYGVKIDASTTVQDAMAKDSIIKAQVSAMVRGAEITKIEYLQDDSCIVTAKINIKKFKQKLKDMGIAY